MQQLDTEVITSREEADRLLAGSISSHRVRQFILKNLKRDLGNRFYWRLNINALEANMLNISGSIIPEDDSLHSEVPALFIKGERSLFMEEKDDAIISRLFPKSAITVIENSGHWVHAEQPELFIRAVCDFLNCRNSSSAN